MTSKIETEKDIKIKKGRLSTRGGVGYKGAVNVGMQRGGDLTLAESDFLFSKLLHAVKKEGWRRIERERDRVLLLTTAAAQPIRLYRRFY